MRTTLSRDPFARTELIREVLFGLALTISCSWCGQRPIKEGKNWLVRFGTEHDGRRGTAWHSGYFCNKGCHDSYHGRGA